MKVKSSEDYIAELTGYFPAIEEKEMKKVVKTLATNHSKYMRRYHRGIVLKSSNTLLQDKKPGKFIVARIYGRQHLLNMRKAFRKRKALKDGKN